MVKLSRLAVALLFASTSVAVLASEPAQPAATGAASVQNSSADAKSNGKADKGLDTAEKHITAKHGKAEKGEKAEGKAEKVERVAKVDRPAKPERPGR